MTAANGDRLDAVVAAFLDYLEERGPRPALDHLTPGERREAEQLLALIEGGRGTDPASIPPLDEDPAVAAFQAAKPTPALGLSVPATRVTTQLQLLNRDDLVVTLDVTSGLFPDAPSDLMVRVSGLRIRVRLVEPEDAATLADDLLASADRTFNRHPDTTAVALVALDADLSCLIVEPHETRPAFEAPTGRLGPARPARPILPFRSAVQSYLDGVEPLWDDPGALADRLVEDSDIAGSARRAATDVLADVVNQGRRATNPTKKATWSALGDREAEALVGLAVQAGSGPADQQALRRQLDRLVGDAA
jgi:hypothetical protein